MIGTFFGILWVDGDLGRVHLSRTVATLDGTLDIQPGCGPDNDFTAFRQRPSRLPRHVPQLAFFDCAAILGLFCGLARRQTGGIQAGMVAHAFTVAVWKMFLQ